MWSRDIGPVLPTVPCYLHQAIVGAGPDQAFFQGDSARAKTQQPYVGLRVVRREATGSFLLALIIGREIGADHCPTVATIGRLVHVLAADIDSVVIVG